MKIKDNVYSSTIYIYLNAKPTQAFSRVITCLEYDNSPIETPFERQKARLRGIRDRSGVVGTAEISFGIQAVLLSHVVVHHM
jgi:hypothetical protein